MKDAVEGAAPVATSYSTEEGKTVVTSERSTVKRSMNRSVSESDIHTVYYTGFGFFFMFALSLQIYKQFQHINPFQIVERVPGAPPRYRAMTPPYKTDNLNL